MHSKQTVIGEIISVNGNAISVHLPFEELINLFGGTLSDVNREYIRSKIVEAKINTAEKIHLQVEKEFISADSPIPYNIKQLWFQLDDFERQTFSERAKPETKTLLRVEGNADKLISNEYQPASAGGGSPFLNNQAIQSPHSFNFCIASISQSVCVLYALPDLHTKKKPLFDSKNDLAISILAMI